MVIKYKTKDSSMSSLLGNLDKASQNINHF